MTATLSPTAIQIRNLTKTYPNGYKALNGVNRHLLQRVGGRYQFIHRLVQKRFALSSLDVGLCCGSFTRKRP